jgi:plastocyanin
LIAVGSIRADVSKRPFALVAGLAILAAACSSVPTATTIDYGSGTRFVVLVGDTLDNVGLASSVGVDGTGLPFISYFGFPAPVKPGQIPVPRPIGTPFLPGVLLASVNGQGVWTQGAIEQNKPAVTPAGVNVPFGPVTTANLALTPDDTNGTAIAVASDGTVHAAWTQADGVYYGTTKEGGSATVTKVHSYGASVSLAGPMSAPGIVLDPNGNPWVAFSVAGPLGFEVHAAMLQGSSWKDQVVVSEPACADCPEPGPAGIAFAHGNPMVVYGDVVKHEVDAATLQGSKWVVATVEKKTDGLGLAVAAVKDTVYASYYTGRKSVDVATIGDHGTTTRQAGSAANPEPRERGNNAARTAIAVKPDGTISVAWDDSTNGVQFFSQTSGTESFTSIPLGPSGASSAHPALVATDTSVFLSWYDTINQDLMLGQQGDVQNLIVANPQPSLTVSAGPAGPGECGKDKKVQLTLTAPSVSFDPTCLVAKAGQPFSITFDNQDTANQHNLDVLDKQGGSSFGKTDIATGPIKETLDLSPLDPGDYYFQCDVHPTQMFGTLAVVK